MMRCIVATLVACFLCASPVLADSSHPARLQVGDHVVMSHDWNHKTDTWARADAKVKTACFRVLAVKGEATEMELVSGLYHPWWSNEVLLPGFLDTWDGNTKLYLAEHPKAAPRELTRGLFTTVTECGKNGA